MARFKYSKELVEFLIEGHFVFEWDTGNKEKNLIKHGILCVESENAFVDESILPLGIQVFLKKEEEVRYAILGRATVDRVIFVCFTIRSKKIRVISARVASTKERGIYETFSSQAKGK